MSDATIIFLNGVSSAGKSSIARVLQATLDEPYLHVPIDSFEDMLPERYDEGGAFDWPVVFQKLLAGMHQSYAALASAGNNLIIDHVMVHREGWASSLATCLTALEPYRVYFIAVRCPLDELLRREQARGDRYEGTAARQFPLVHLHALYDLEVDTAQASAEVCAEQIRALMASHEPQAFAALRQLPAASLP